MHARSGAIYRALAAARGRRGACDFQRPHPAAYYCRAALDRGAAPDMRRGGRLRERDAVVARGRAQGGERGPLGALRHFAQSRANAGVFLATMNQLHSGDIAEALNAATLFENRTNRPKTTAR